VSLPPLGDTAVSYKWLSIYRQVFISLMTTPAQFTDKKARTKRAAFEEHSAHFCTSCFQVLPDLIEAITYLGARLPEAVHGSGHDECL